MDLEELEKVQSTKPQIIVDSGFASNIQDTLGKLREFALGFSSSKVTEVSQSPDLHIIQAINSLDEIDKIEKLISKKLGDRFTVKHTASGKGKLVIDYADMAELKEFIKRIK